MHASRLVCAFCLACAPAGAQECSPRVVFALGGQFIDADADARLLALAQGRAGALLFDIENPAEPLELARTPGDARRVAIGPDALASVSSEGVVSFYDLAVPDAPAALAAIATPAAQPSDLIWLAPALYVLSPATGTWVIDAADPRLPRLVGPLPGSTPARRAAHDGAILLVARDADTRVFDLTDPLHPRNTGTIEGATDGLALRVPVAFTCLDNDLRAIDISRPDSPATLWTDQTDLTYSPTLATAGDRLYWVQHGWDLASFDIADPASRTPLTTRQRWLYPQALTHSGDTLITVGQTETRLSSPSRSSQTAVLDHLPARNATLRVVGRRAFFQPSISSVGIVDITDPTNLTTLHEIPNTVCTWTDGEHMLSARSQFQVWDVREGHTPTLLGAHPLSAGVWEFAATTSLAFLRDDEDRFSILDWSDPTDPHPLSPANYPDAFAPFAVTPAGLLCGWDPRAYRLLLLDVTNPESPVTIGEIPTPSYCFDANIQGDLLLTHERMVRLFDISNPASPRMLSVLPDASYQGVLDGDLFYQVGDPAQVWDLSDPARPAQLGFIPDLPELSNLARAGDHWVVIAANLDGDLYSSLATARLEPDSGAAMLSRIETIPAATHAAASSGRAAINASYPYGLWFIDLQDPDRPRVIARAATSTSGPLAMDDRYTYCYSIDTLCVLEGDSAGSARVVGSVPLGRPAAMHRKGDRLYLAVGKSGVIVSVADPTNPTVLAVITAEQAVRGFDADADTACLSLQDATIAFYDIRDPHNITELSRIHWGYEGGQIRFQDAWVTAAVGTANLCFFDAADPANPTLASFVRGTDGPITRFLTEGDTVYATARGSVMLFDVSDRHNPRLLAEARNLTDDAIPLRSDGRLFLAGSPAPALIAIDTNCDPCPADFDADGDADTADLVAYLNAWAAQRGQICIGKYCAADTDGNGVVDTRDFVAYLNAWAAGC